MTHTRDERKWRAQQQHERAEIKKLSLTPAAIGNAANRYKPRRTGSQRNGLNPTLPDNPCHRRLVRKHRAMIGGAQYVIDRNAVIGQREESTAIEDWHAAKGGLTLDNQTSACREDRRQMGKEQACQRVPGAERYCQVLAYGGEIRQFDWRLHSDHDAIRPVVTDHPGINFVEARKALSRCHFLPVAQHTLGQAPLALPRSRRVGLWRF